MTYSIGEFVVCPGHGVGQVCDLEEKLQRGSKEVYFIIKVLSNGLRIMIPESDQGKGVRKLAESHEVDKVFDLLKSHDVKIDKSAYNRRSRDYALKINSGSLLEIADVVRSLYLLKSKKSLSFGERRILKECMDLLVKEISISKGQDEAQVSSQIEACFSQV